MPKNILVTGAAGFLGSHICQYFGQREYSIIGVDKFSPPIASADIYVNLKGFYDINLPDEAFVGIVREFRPALIIHCAGSASVPNSMQEPYYDFKQSAGVTAFILESLRQHLPSCHFIFLSSAAVYGNPEKLPIPEDAPCQPISPYGYHKYICELLCQEYHSLYSMKCSTLRIFSAYGERLRKQVIFDLCRKFTDPSSKSVEIYGTGDETRDFVHAIDIAQAVERILKAGALGMFNIASGVQTPIRMIAELIKQSLTSDKNIVFSGSTRPGDPLRWQADIAKLAALGFVPKISLTEGIMSYCRWFVSEYGERHV